MQIFIAQQNYHIGNFEANTHKIIEAIQAAEAQGGDLIVFSELAICGYPPRDFLEFNDFIEACLQSIETIKPYTANIGVIVGCPSINAHTYGKNLHNSAYYIYQQKVQQIVHKTLLPTYDIFDEYRYFEPAYEWNLVEHKGVKIAVTICEDIWNLTEDPLYRICPMDKLMPLGPQLMVNLSASPYDYIHANERQQIIKENVNTYKLPIIYCNTVGSQTEIIFDGGSMALDAAGNVLAQLPFFEEALTSILLPIEASNMANPTAATLNNSPAPTLELNFEANQGIADIYQALLLGIRDYFGKMGFKKAIVASSGGIDSAVVLAVACAALGAENVTALLLPSQYSSDHSVSDAKELSENLQNEYHIIPIAPVFNAYEGALQPVFGDLPFNVAEENLQSRIRGAMVMALANKFDYILLNTSNKSELATGYGTLYGDMAGGLGVIGDLYKEQVYALARYINRSGAIIPESIITKAPSAELRPNQKDSDSLPEYDVLDPILYHYIECRKGPKELIALGHDAALVHRILKLVNRNEYKRNQFCPILRVSPKAFGIGRRMPIVGKYLS